MKPILSILIPFYKESPCALIEALKAQPIDKVEIITFDDGSHDVALTRSVTALCQDNIHLITSPKNVGRAKGRNILVEHARSDYLLFLDSDMLPDSPHFLQTWLDHIHNEDPDVTFGGFSLKYAPKDQAFALHRLMASQSDCLPARLRQLQPEKYVFTSNLLVKTTLIKRIGFDNGFSGWGWEDVEWAMRIAEHAKLLHIDNSATHMGLDQAATLVRKYKESASNFARVYLAHPEVVRAYPSFKWARRLKRLPLRPLWRDGLQALALNNRLPLNLRSLSLRLYRACLYAEVV